MNQREGEEKQQQQGVGAERERRSSSSSRMQSDASKRRKGREPTGTSASGRGSSLGDDGREKHDDRDVRRMRFAMENVVLAVAASALLAA